LNALRGRTGCHPELEHVLAVIDRVVAVEKPLGLGKCPVAVFVNVDIVVDSNLETRLQFVSLSRAYSRIIANDVRTSSGDLKAVTQPSPSRATRR
jgi:hypothetical protein